MSRAEQAPERAGVAHLVVPAVEPGDVGLVVVVHELEWDGGYRRWWLTAGGGNRYVLPRELHCWARGLNHDARRSLVRFPKVFAFSQQGDSVAARILSTA